jgi:hypothetical protein
MNHTLSDKVDTIEKQIKNIFDIYFPNIQKQNISINKFIEMHDYQRIYQELRHHKINNLQNTIYRNMCDNDAYIPLFQNLKQIKNELCKLLYADPLVIQKDGNADFLEQQLHKFKTHYFILESQFDKEKYSIKQLNQRFEKNDNRISDLNHLLTHMDNINFEIQMLSVKFQKANDYIAFQYDNNLYQLFQDFVKNIVFPFLTINLPEIKKWYQKMPPDKQLPENIFKTVRQNIMKHAGITPIPIEPGKTRFNLKYHKERASLNDRKYPKNIILDINEQGYQIDWCEVVLHKAGVVVNYR